MQTNPTYKSAEWYTMRARVLAALRLKGERYMPLDHIRRWEHMRNGLTRIDTIGGLSICVPTSTI